MSRFQRGFTLIEIMIVVAILAALAIVAIPGFMAYVHASKKNLCVSNLDMLNRATETYVIAHGLQPGDDITLDMLSPASGNVAGNRQYLLKNRPVCPIGGIYSYDSNTGTWSCSASESE